MEFPRGVAVLVPVGHTVLYMGRTNAGARYRELGAELRERRVWAGLTGAELAHMTGWSPAKITRIETGQTRIGPVDLMHYLGFCKVYLAQALDLLEICRDAERKMGYWLSPQGEMVANSLGSLIYHETTADRSTTYEPLTVPGLLQTADYARTWIARVPWLDPSDVERGVEIRMQRQRILNVPHPATFRFLIHEQVLHTVAGSPAIMHEQLLKLALASALDHITIRVVPSSAFGGAFVLFEYADYPPLVCLDTYKTGLFLEDKEYVGPFRELVPAISKVALDEGQSRELIATLASEYDQGSERDEGDRLEEEQL